MCSPLIAFSQVHSFLLYFYNRNPCLSNSAAHKWFDLSTSVINQENPPINMSTGQLDLDNSLLRLSSQVILVVSN